MEQETIKKINILITSIFVFTFAAIVIANTSNEIVFSDSDQDGLSDEEESSYGTDPNNADTDGDSYSDGTEVKSGYDPLKPAPGDKIIPEKENVANISKSALSEGPLTKKFKDDMQEFLSEKEEGSVTQEDISSFFNENMKEVFSEVNSLTDLPEIDSSKIKTKSQKYDNLSEEERLEKELLDWNEYLGEMIERFMHAKLGEKPESEEEFLKFIDELGEKNAALVNGGSPDYEYFRSLADKTEIFIKDAQKITVPETLLGAHVDFLRILNGYLSLRDPSLPKIEEDEMVEIFVYTKTRGLNNVLTEFLSENFVKYSSRFEELK